MPLAGKPALSGGCDLKLTLDREKPADTLDALRRHLSELDQVEDGLKAELEDFTPQPGHGRGRARRT